MKRQFILLSLFILVSLLGASLATGGTITGRVEAKGLRHSGDVVVYIEGNLGGKTFTAPAEAVIMDQREMTYFPHVLPILVGSTVAFPNSDEVRHNVNSKSKAKKFNLGTYKPGLSRSVTFDKLGIVEVLCHLHKDMKAWILVLENPYYTVTNGGGNFTISDVPEGKYSLTAWHEKLKPQTKEAVVPAQGNVEIEFELIR